MLCHGDFQFSFSQSVSLGFEGREKVHPQNHGAVPRGCQLPHSFWNILQNPVNGWIFIGFFGFQCRANPEILGYIWILRVKMIRGLQHRLWNFTVLYCSLPVPCFGCRFFDRNLGDPDPNQFEIWNIPPGKFFTCPLRRGHFKRKFLSSSNHQVSGHEKVSFQGVKIFWFSVSWGKWWVEINWTFTCWNPRQTWEKNNIVN